MTRIISGLAGSLRLDVPKSGTRPTSDRVREAMFSALESWGMTDGVSVLDVFAGSGALGIEAASRGASQVTLIEKHPPAVQIVQHNVSRYVDAVGPAAEAVFTQRRSTALTYVEGLANTVTFDVVFVDPPYDFSQRSLTQHLEALAPHVTPDGLVMVERSTRDSAPEWPAALRLFTQKTYGETTLWWAERADRDLAE